MIAQEPVRDGAHAKELICQLGAQFYHQGWVSGTGGGISIRHEEYIYMAPSGVLKEALTPDMIFTLDVQGEMVDGPAGDRGLRVSECRPLFLHAYNKRGAGAVLHSHSRHAALATMISGETHLEITRLEMLKGLSGVGYYDVHRVPVIDNTARECELTDGLGLAIDANPDVHGVLVRDHGVYVWGTDWISAKRHAECYDYLFAMAVDMHRLGLRPQPV
jgi:methylthioribulose-1-phosphate dehydratase